MEEKILSKNSHQDVKLATLEERLDNFKESITSEIKLYREEFIRFRENEFKHLNDRIWTLILLLITSIIVPIFLKIVF